MKNLPIHGAINAMKVLLFYLLSSLFASGALEAPFFSFSKYVTHCVFRWLASMAQMKSLANFNSISLLPAKAACKLNKLFFQQLCRTEKWFKINSSCWARGKKFHDYIWFRAESMSRRK
jgi:hypothetical protein